MEKETEAVIIAAMLLKQELEGSIAANVWLIDPGDIAEMADRLDEALLKLKKN